MKIPYIGVPVSAIFEPAKPARCPNSIGSNIDGWPDTKTFLEVEFRDPLSFLSCFFFNFNTETHQESAYL